MTSSILQLAQKLYSLNTLDTRFTTSSKTPPRVNTPQIDTAKPISKGGWPHNASLDEIDSGKLISKVSRSRWEIVEYYVYHTAVFVAIAIMAKVAIGVSIRMSPLAF